MRITITLKLLLKAKNVNFLTHYFTTSPGEGGRRGVRNLALAALAFYLRAPYTCPKHNFKAGEGAPPT